MEKQINTVVSNKVYTRKVGQNLIHIAGSNITILSNWNSNTGIIYDFNLIKWFNYSGPEYLTPQILGMESKPNKTVTKIIYAYLKRITKQYLKEQGNR